MSDILDDLESAPATNITHLNSGMRVQDVVFNMVCAGYTINEIAEATQRTPEIIAKIARSVPLQRDLLAKSGSLNVDRVTDGMMRSLLFDALNQLAALVHSKSDSIKLSAIKEVLTYNLTPAKDKSIRKSRSIEPTALDAVLAEAEEEVRRLESA